MSYPYGATNAVSFGPFSASSLQQPSSIAIGASAGRRNQGGNAIAIGTLAGQLNQHQSTIVLNATGTALDTTNDNSIYMAPMRFTTASGVMAYNPTSKEVSYTDTLSTLTVSSMSTRALGFSTLVGSSMNTSVITANLLYCNTISTVGGIVVGGGGGGGGGGGSSGPVAIIANTPATTQSIPADTNTLVLWDSADSNQSVGITGLSYLNGLFTNTTGSALPFQVDYSLELSITGGGASYIGINGPTNAYGRLLNDSNIFTNTYTILVPAGGTVGVYYRDTNATVVQTTSRIALTLLTATQGQVATLAVSPTVTQALPASPSLSLVLWGTTDNAQSYGSTGLNYVNGLFINITSAILPVLVQYTLNLDSTMGGYSAIGINGSTTVYGGMYNDTNGFTNSYTVMVPAYGTLGIYYMDNGATTVQTTSTLRLTILMAGATGASPWTVSGTTASYTVGNVGIGTTAPAATLDVSGTINSVSMVTVSDARPAVNGLLRLVATGGLNYVQSGLALTSDSKAPLIFGSVFNVSEWMRIITSGNVGIGTTNPTALLHLRPTTSALRITSNLTNAATRPAISTTPGTFEIRGSSADGDVYDDGFLRLSAGGGTSATSQASIDLSGYSTQADMNINIRFATSGAERMRITNGGNVGIGTTSPGSRLEVLGGGTTNLGGGLYTLSGTGSSPTITAQNGSISGTNPFTFTLNTTNGQMQTTYPFTIGGYYTLTFNASTASSGITILIGALPSNAGYYTTPTLTNTSTQYSFSFVATSNTNLLLTFLGSVNGTVVTMTPFTVTQLNTIASGNVGIGSTAPSYKLDVIGGSARIGTTTTTNTIIASNTVQITNPTASFISYNGGYPPNSSTIVRNSVAAWFGTRDGVVSRGAAIDFEDVSTNGTYPVEIRSSQIKFYTEDVVAQGQDAPLRMILSPQGNLGIGTASPYKLLHLTGSSTGDIAALIANTNTAVSSSASLAFGLWGSSGSGTGTSSPAAQISAIVMNASQGNTDLAFNVYTGNAVAPTYTLVECMRITAGGNVGIGTASPNAKLHVCTSDAGNVIATDSAVGSQAVFSLRKAGSQKASLYVAANSNDLALYTDTAGYNVMVVGGDGYVYLNTGRYGNGTLSVTSGQVLSSSDRRIKTDITYAPKEGNLDKLLQLKPATYSFTNTRYPDVHMGFIAQDVETLFPHCVDGKKYEYAYEVEKDEYGNDTIKPRLDEHGEPIWKRDANGERIIRPRGFDDRALLAHTVLSIQELYDQSKATEQALRQELAEVKASNATLASQLAALTAWAQAQGFSA